MRKGDGAFLVVVALIALVLGLNMPVATFGGPLIVGSVLLGVVGVVVIVSGESGSIADDIEDSDT